MSQYATPDQLQAFSMTAASYARVTPNGDLSYVISNLQAASGFADLFLSEQFDLPLLSWGATLSKWVCDIAAYEVSVQFGYNAASSADSNLLRRYEQAKEALLGVSRHEIHLDTSPDFTDSSNGQAEDRVGPFASSAHKVGFGEIHCGDFDDFGGEGWND